MEEDYKRLPAIIRVGFTLKRIISIRIAPP